MFDDFQLIYPGMIPIAFGILSLFLFLIALVSGVLIYWSIRRMIRRKKFFVPILFLLIGITGFSYTVMNTITYNRIFAAAEKRIVGDFYEDSSTIPLRVHADHTWTYAGKNLGCNKGTWEYVSSEDWCYWNIDSKGKGSCHLQTGDPHIIQFREKCFAFRKK
ncbi:MAG: hypothetical protein ACO1N0_09300 [Fluviicola sp.]